MLTLPIKKKWFEMIRKGIKLEEYREIKPYYESRFSKLWQGSLIGEEAIREKRWRKTLRTSKNSSPKTEFITPRKKMLKG